MINNDDGLFVELEENYKEESNLNMRYDRQKRLENAPPNVRLLHSKGYIKKQSFLASIMSNKGHKFIFMAIAILTLLNLGLYFYYYSSKSGKIDGIKVELDSFFYNGELLVNAVFYENEKLYNETKDINVLLKAYDGQKTEICVKEKSGVYMGQRVMLHFNLVEKNIKRVDATIKVNNKVMQLSKKI